MNPGQSGILVGVQNQHAATGASLGYGGNAAGGALHGVGFYVRPFLDLKRLICSIGLQNLFCLPYF